MPNYFATLPTPLGELLVSSDGAALTGLTFDARPEPDWLPDPATLAPSVRELRAYFAGELREFTLPVNLSGTPFQKRVWAELTRIPYGETISYAELAKRVGKPTASRAVGGANGANRVCVVVPCHRVIAADGTLGGFGGGLWRKAWLLNREAGEEKWVVPGGRVLSAAG